MSRDMSSLAVRTGTLRRSATCGTLSRFMPDTRLTALDERLAEVALERVPRELDAAVAILPPVDKFNPTTHTDR